MISVSSHYGHAPGPSAVALRHEALGSGASTSQPCKVVVVVEAVAVVVAVVVARVAVVARVVVLVV